MKKRRITPKQIVKSILVAFGLIAFWRGIWGLMDLYLFPMNESLSFITSTILGLIVLALTHHVVQELMGSE